MRTLIGALGVLVTMLAMGVQAQGAFPSRPVRLVVPNAPGGAIDIQGQLYRQYLGQLWNQPVIVEYKPGANTAVGTEFVAKSAPDGHTIGLVVTSHVINPTLRKMPYDTVKDFAGIMLTGASTIAISATPSLEANTLPELIALAKRQPGKLAYASPGSGSSMHLAGELLKQMAGIDMLHVPFKGSGPAFPEVMAGRIQLIIDPIFSSQPHVKSGKLKFIATTSAKRDPVAPNVATVAETLPGFTVESINGLVVPAGTPREIVQRLHADFGKVLQMPEVKARMAELSINIIASTPEQFDAFVKTEIDRWTKVVQAANVKVD